MRRLSYANVVSTICLFIVLGGGAYAAMHLPKNSVGRRQLKKNAVNGAKVKDRSLTGADLNLATIDLPGGSSGPYDYVHGNGQVLVARQGLKSGEKEVRLFEIPQIGTLSAECFAGGGNFELATKSSEPIDFTYTTGVGGPPPAHDGGSFSASDPPLQLGENDDETFVVQLATQTPSPTIATITASLQKEPGKCTMFAQAVVGVDGPVAVP